MPSTTLAATTLSLLLNGAPLESTYLRSADPSCLITQKAAAAWRAQGHRVVEKTIAEWCSVGTVIAGDWVAEQWRQIPGRAGSEGWRITIPLAKAGAGNRLGLGPAGGPAHSSASSASAIAIGSASRPWGLQVHDRGIQSAIQVRRSLNDLQTHHQETLALIGREISGSKLSGPLRGPLTEQIIRRSPQSLVSEVGHGVMVISAQTPALGSYSVVIRRGVAP
jgi:hypothetical protein